MFMIKKAFTLAEVMVTLTVLGVLAAILVPAITNIAPDTNKVMFKKSYSVFENTIQAMLNDDNVCPSSVTGNVGTQTAVPLGLSQMNAAQDGSIPFCYYFSQAVNTIGTVSCSSAATSTTPSFTTSDGIVWYFTKPTATAAWDDDTGSGNYAKVVVDVNGSKKPDCGAKIQSTYSNDNACGSNSQDRYMFGVRFDGKIKVFDQAGQDILSNPTNNCRSGSANCK